MVTEIIMPKLGETMEEGIITKWRKKEGEKIEKGEILFEVMTDKANFEMESPAAGIVRRLFAKEDETVAVTKIVGYIASSMDEEVPSAPASEPVKSVGGAQTTQPVPSKQEEVVSRADTGDRIKVSPLAKRLAKEKGIDLSSVKGSGTGGRIEKEDILKIVESSSVEEVEISIPKDAKTIPVKGVRKIIADRMTQAKQTVPHFYLTSEVDMTKAVELRDKFKQEKIYFSHNDLIVKAVAEALKEFPIVNGYFAGDRIVLNPYVNVCIAVTRPAVQKTSAGEDMDVGELVVPVLKDADKKNLLDIAVESKELIRKARENKLNLDELEGGTITVSNLGSIGIDVFTAIVYAPQATLLAVGEIKKRPVAIDDKIEIRSVAKFTLSCDHRIVDGSMGARFLQKLKAILENPQPLMPQ